MAYKDPLDPRNRAARRRHYQANKDQYLRRNREQKDRLKEIVRQAKDKPCADCGVKYPHYVMDLHHRDPSEKLANVGVFTTRSERMLRAEIAKCDVVCANCHRERTHGREATGADEIPNLVSIGFDS